MKNRNRLILLLLFSEAVRVEWEMVGKRTFSFVLGLFPPLALTSVASAVLIIDELNRVRPPAAKLASAAASSTSDVAWDTSSRNGKILLNGTLPGGSGEFNFGM